MATMQQAIDAIQAKVRALSGIRAAPDEAPEGAGAFPFAICYPVEGTWTLGNPEGAMKGLHTVHLEIHCARKNLEKDLQIAMAYSENVMNALAGDLTLGGTCDNIGSISYRFGEMRYGGKQTLGWQFRITFKQKPAVT